MDVRNSVDDLRHYNLFLERHHMHWFSALNLLPGSDMITQMELDYMHMEIIGIVEGIHCLIICIRS